MILSSARIAQEYEGYVDAPLRVLNFMGMPHLTNQFFLFIRVLLEYEQGDQSPYKPWLESLPRKWNTAVAMDEFCLSCLPPYIKSLCLIEKNQLEVFRQSLNKFEYISAETKANEEIMKFAYNVVFTRARPTEEGDHKIVPVADFMNHAYPENSVLTYDENGGCSVYTTADVGPGEALTLNYGHPTNPSRFLATYGFLDEPQAFFCKLLSPNPSQALKDVGYDPSRMLFFTADGAISQEVWDVLLYSRLEKKPELEEVKNAFYQAHMTGDGETKGAIHAQFQQDTVGALLRHVTHILIEVADLTVNMNSFDASKHPRLPLLKKHHTMVTDTFTKVRDYLMAIQE